MVKVKKGVTPPLIILVCAVANTAEQLNLNYDVVITSGTDGKHMKNSKHFIGAAIDVRSSNFPSVATRQRFVEGLRSRLGPDYDVVLESDHFHLEFDPKS